MSGMTRDDVITILKSITDKQSGKNIIQMGMISELSVDEMRISINITPRSPDCPVGLKMAYDVKVLLVHMPGVQKVDVVVKGHKHAEEMNKLIREF